MHTRTVDALIAAAALSEAQGRPEQAQKLYEKALATAQSLYGRQSPVSGLILLKLVEIYDQFGRIGEAELARGTISEIMTVNAPWLLSQGAQASNGANEEVRSSSALEINRL